jgi:hypothetical protein
MIKTIKKYSALLLVVMLSYFGETVNAQATKHTQSFTQVWLAYNNQTRFSKRWGAWLDLHLRTKDDFFNNLSQTIIRPGITYYVSDAVKLTQGYAYVTIYPADNHSKVSQPEHRIWQQVQWHTKYTRLRTMQWLRLEERFKHRILNDSTLGEGHNFNFRLRYNFLLQVPLSETIRKGSFSFIVNDEVHLNFGKEIVYNTFDQNRLFVGFAYNLNAQDNLQFGYMNVFQQLSSGDHYKSLNVARIYYFHNLDFRKKNS